MNHISLLFCIIFSTSYFLLYHIASAIRASQVTSVDNIDEKLIILATGTPLQKTQSKEAYNEFDESLV